MEMINIKINCESLNAAIAASIIMYELNRQGGFDGKI